MAYKSKNISVLAYANGFTQWHYTTTDGSVFTDGYFNDAGDMVRVGDVIVCNMDGDDKIDGYRTANGPKVAIVAVTSVTKTGEKNSRGLVHGQHDETIVVVSPLMATA